MEIINKDEFLALDIESQVNFINSRTREGLLVSQVAKEIGISDKALRSLLKKNGYSFNRSGKVYILEEEQGNTTGITEIIKEEPKSNNIGITKKEKYLFSEMEIKELKELLEIKEELKNIINMVKNNSGISIIDIANIDRSNRKKATFNMDKDILDILQYYSDTQPNKNINKSDIVNIAIKEYLNKNGITKE